MPSYVLQTNVLQTNVINEQQLNSREYEVETPSQTSATTANDPQLTVDNGSIVDFLSIMANTCCLAASAFA